MTAVAVPEPAVWGVGRIVVGGEVVPWPVSAADVDDETEVAAEHLRGLGVGQDGLVLLVSRLSQAIHVAAFERAARLVGALYSSADATPGDAFRTGALVRALRPQAVIGLTADVVGALGTDVFAGVGALATADEDAHAALEAAGLAPRRWLKLGPTSAVECAARTGAHADGARWSVETRDGEVLVSNRAPRLTRAERLATGVRGEIVDGECACGRAGPRIVIP